MSQPSHSATRSIYYGWLPQHREIHHAFLDEHVNGTRPADGTFYEPKNRYVKDFIQAIKGSNIMEPLSNAMFEQLKIYTKNPEWKEEASHQVDSLDHLAAILDSIVETGPKFWRLKNSKGEVIGEPVGVPILVALDLLSNTPAAYDLFRWKDFNVEMKKLLNGWGDMLKTPKSAEVFADAHTGWFCQKGLEMLEQGLKGATFDDTFAHDTGIPLPQRYKSWDSFFTRKFRDVKKSRPVEKFDGRRKDFPVINNACESTSLRVYDDVQLQDQFWLKGQNYSLYDMLGSLAADHAKGFEGGSAYQAFLSPQDFHHWNSPVKGKVVATVTLEGTYYAVLPDEGSPGDDGLRKGDPHGALIRCQPWLSVSAARSIFIIEPDNQEIAKVALIGIGMAEVSSCEPSAKVKGATPQAPVPVEAGEELGMFHFGGSTHVLLIKLRHPDKKQLVFKDINDIQVEANQHRWINSIIARVEDIPSDD